MFFLHYLNFENKKQNNMTKLNANLLLLLIIAFIFSACTQTKKTEEQYLNSAKTLLDSAVAKNDNNLFNEAVKTYREYVKEYPNSDKAISAYMQIGGIYMDNLKNYPEAIKTYKEITEKYADKKEAKNSMFMIAFIYDNNLQDKQNAKDAYKKFLEKYPTDTDPNEKMSESAKVMLEALESNKSIEDLIMNKIQNESSGQDNKKEDVKKDEKKDDANTKPKKTDVTPDDGTDQPKEKK